jgi:hypothetical protein
LPRNRTATSAGINVIDRMVAPVNAKSTVTAMGRNIFPSIPVSARMGT